MKRVIWHYLRAILLFTWLIVYYRDNSVSLLLPPILLLAGIYDIVLARFQIIDTSIRRKIAAIVILIVIVSMLLERSPWDDLIGYVPLSLYLPELIIDQKSRKQKMLTLSSVTIALFITILFSLYRIGWTISCPNATINGRPVMCQVIKVFGSTDIIMIVDGYWRLIDADKSNLKLVSSHRSSIIGNLAFIDVRSQKGILVKNQPGKAQWDPKLSYKNKSLSFYFLPGRLFICNELKI